MNGVENNVYMKITDSMFLLYKYIFCFPTWACMYRNLMVSLVSVVTCLVSEKFLYCDFEMEKSFPTLTAVFLLLLL